MKNVLFIMNQPEVTIPNRDDMKVWPIHINQVMQGGPMIYDTLDAAMIPVALQAKQLDKAMEYVHRALSHIPKEKRKVMFY